MPIDFDYQKMKPSIFDFYFEVMFGMFIFAAL